MRDPLATISTAGMPFSWTIWTLLTTRGGPKFCAAVPIASAADSINRYTDFNPNRGTRVLNGRWKNDITWEGRREEREGYLSGLWAVAKNGVRLNEGLGRNSPTGGRWLLTTDHGLRFLRFWQELVLVDDGGYAHPTVAHGVLDPNDPALALHTNALSQGDLRWEG